MTKKLSAAIIFSLFSLHAQAADPSFEMRRITRTEGSEGASVTRCMITPNLVRVETEIGGLSSFRSLPLETNGQKIQAYIEKVKGIPQPSVEGAKKVTKWLIRTQPDKSFVLIRSNVDGNILQDDCYEAKVLAEYLGANCSLQRE